MATITSAEEQAFVQGLLAAGEYCWIGLRQQGGKEPLGGWKWVTREKLIYSNWNNGEPNNSGDVEDFAEMNSDGYWNDQNPTTVRSCFIKEWETAQ